ncbi:16S rRNA (guanine(966)-N(2))-methyltransferase RsmD [Rhodoferax koreense]|uniref:16S rRNA (Guanine(966)-N(2))-methyltransferase RsmD n=1 Tax=Rhodoferax koreensis TaxID=1842727 RepID=A0A1P8JZU5_9BURK|nr:16S rRNA (guanine(966)-N(2))-methyltransferase RsmD [Rhodoferax koreense]APW39273.1 16S rRNA (guanine(966)-N(2))-methyltransferase RsmD [Rhodoferax koreense]
MTTAPRSERPQAKKKPTTPRRNTTPPGEIRLIGGLWKRTKLPVADKPGLRPTPDRVRETLFNWLGQDLTGWRCIDAFAGTGALGFEAASRGAAEVIIVEQDGILVSQLMATQKKLAASAVQVRRGDGVGQLRQLAPASQDAVFLDPPFDAEVYEPALRAAAAAIKPDGQIYLEAGQRWTDEALAEIGLALHRHLKAGAVHAHLLRRLPDTATA